MTKELSVTKIIEAKDFSDLIERLTETVLEGYSTVGRVQSAALGLGLKARTADFDVLTKECGKVYTGKGLTGMVAIVSELLSNGRDIRSVTPISVFKDNILTSEYTVSMLRPPKEINEEELEVSVEVPEENTLNTEDEKVNLKKLSKKELVALCKEKELSGNIQETKAVLIERIEDSEKEVVQQVESATKDL